jgi:hypothetical protein
MSTIESTLAERGARYGKFSEHAEIAQSIQDAMRVPPGWARLAPDQKQALTVIADKVARMLNGDPNYIDNWHDIIGYAKLVEDRLNERSAAEWTEANAAQPRVRADHKLELDAEPYYPVVQNNWIKWPGGDMPVLEGTLVDVVYRDGCEVGDLRAGLFEPHRVRSALTWAHIDSPSDIVEYRLSVVSEGWKPWPGGTIPVPSYKQVEIRMRQHGTQIGRAGSFRWHWSLASPSADIVEYRVIG